jgi:hypothetical protein
MARCAGEPGLTASAFSSIRFEYDTCTDNAGPFYHIETGRKDCSGTGDSTCYAHCSDEGYCSTAQSGTPCSGPSATPPPNGCAWPPPAPCCTQETVNQGTPLETCRWNCQPPDCGTGTEFRDGCYSVSGPMVCPDGYNYTTSDNYGPACCPATPTPTPTPCTIAGESCGRCCSGTHCNACTGTCTDNYSDGCNQSQEDTCRCSGGYMKNCHCTYGGPGSPIIVDVLGDGFHLTDAGNGGSLRPERQRDGGAYLVDAPRFGRRFSRARPRRQRRD